MLSYPSRLLTVSASPTKYQLALLPRIQYRSTPAVAPFHAPVNFSRSASAEKTPSVLYTPPFSSPPATFPIHMPVADAELVMPRAASCSVHAGPEPWARATAGAATTIAHAASAPNHPLVFMIALARMGKP